MEPPPLSKLPVRPSLAVRVALRSDSESPPEFESESELVSSESVSSISITLGFDGGTRCRFGGDSFGWRVPSSCPEVGRGCFAAAAGPGKAAEITLEDLDGRGARDGWGREG